MTLEAHAHKYHTNRTQLLQTAGLEERWSEDCMWRGVEEVAYRRLIHLSVAERKTKIGGGQ